MEDGERAVHGHDDRVRRGVVDREVDLRPGAGGDGDGPVRGRRDRPVPTARSRGFERDFDGHQAPISLCHRASSDATNCPTVTRDSGKAAQAEATVRRVAPGREEVLARFREVPAVTERICQPLEPEDYVVQSMTDASPAKWHLGHTSWFFETFVLRADPRWTPVDDRYAFIFNSYYRGAGERHPQPQRGLLSRPTVAQIYRYRREIDRGMKAFLTRAKAERFAEYAVVIELGLHHEQQHQELILTDVKHLFAQNPLGPSYRDEPPAPAMGP